MTDQEKKNSNASAAGGSAVVMVEATTASRHKAFRPTDLQDEAPVELHHKRSRAPAVPSVAEEYKDLAENAALKEQKESDHAAMPSENQKHIIAKISSRRAPSPEAIPMTPVEVEVQKADILPQPTAPIPVPVVPSSTDITDTKEIDENDDSITEEIAELRTAESSHKEWDTENRSQKCVPENQDIKDTEPLQRKLASEIINKIDNEDMNEDPAARDAEIKIPLQRKLASGTVNESITSTKRLKKKEISWTHSTYLDKVQLQNFNTRSVTWILDRKASVGPCFRKTLPYGEPSGITICLPKKSLKSFSENIKQTKQTGGISITVSKRCLDNSTFSSDFEMRNRADRIVLPRKANKVEIKIEEGKCVSFMENLKGTLENWRGKIKHALHM